MMPKQQEFWALFNILRETSKIKNFVKLAVNCGHFKILQHLVSTLVFVKHTGPPIDLILGFFFLSVTFSSFSINNRRFKSFIFNTDQQLTASFRSLHVIKSWRQKTQTSGKTDFQTGSWQLKRRLFLIKMPPRVYIGAFTIFCSEEKRLIMLMTLMLAVSGDGC